MGNGLAGCVGANSATSRGVVAGNAVYTQGTIVSRTCAAGGARSVTQVTQRTASAIGTTREASRACTRVGHAVDRQRRRAGSEPIAGGGAGNHCVVTSRASTTRGLGCVDAGSGRVAIDRSARWICRADGSAAVTDTAGAADTAGAGFVARATCPRYLLVDAGTRATVKSLRTVGLRTAHSQAGRLCCVAFEVVRTRTGQSLAGAHGIADPLGERAPHARGGRTTTVASGIDTRAGIHIAAGQGASRVAGSSARRSAAIAGTADATHVGGTGCVATARARGHGL